MRVADLKYHIRAVSIQGKVITEEVDYGNFSSIKEWFEKKFFTYEDYKKLYSIKSNIFTSVNEYNQYVKQESCDIEKEMQVAAINKEKSRVFVFTAPVEETIEIELNFI